MSPPRFDNLVEMFEQSVRAHGERPLFGVKRGGAWGWTTYREVAGQVEACRGGLAARGIRRGDRVTIVSNNRVEWAVLAHACYGLGAALVPMYEAQRPKEWAFICADAGAVALVAATADAYARCRDLAADVPSLKHVIGMALPGEDAASFAALLAAG